MFQKFLDEVLPEKDVRLVLQEFIGCCLNPNIKLEKALCCVGSGFNGIAMFGSCCPLNSVDQDLTGGLEIVYVSRYDNVFADKTFYVCLYQLVVKMLLGNRSCREEKNSGDNKKCNDL